MMSIILLFEVFIILTALHVLLYYFMICFARSKYFISFSMTLLNKREKKNCTIAFLAFVLASILMFIFPTSANNLLQSYVEDSLFKVILDSLVTLCYVLAQVHLYYLIYKKWKNKKYITLNNEITKFDIILKRMVLLLYSGNCLFSLMIILM